MKNNSEIRKIWFVEQVEKLKSDGHPYAEIAEKLDILPQYLNGITKSNRPASEKMANKLCEAFGINQNSLFNRLKGYDETKEPHVVSEPDKSNKIPLYDIHSVGGINGEVAEVTAVTAPAEWIDAGDWFPQATAAIRHYGDSMKEYTAGSILVLKEVYDRSLLIWGRNYVIETSEYRITKQLQDGVVDYLIGYSTNLETYPDGRQIHSPIPIPKRSIAKIYQVVGCVIKEYSNGALLIK